MRHFGIFSIGTLVFLGGCVLIDTYNYGDYPPVPDDAGTSSSSANASSSGMGTGGMGGSGGVAGMGAGGGSGGAGAGGGGGAGGGIECPPDLCNDQVGDTCREKPDCQIKADLAKRTGDNRHQRALAISVMSKTGDILIAGEYEGALSIGGKTLPDTTQPDNSWRQYPFFARLDTTGNANFASPFLAIRGQARSIVDIPDGILVGGNLSTDGTTDKVYIRKASLNGIHAPLSGVGWETVLGEASGGGELTILRSNDANPRIFVVGNKKGATPLPCMGAMDPKFDEAFLAELNPMNGNCIWGKVFPGVSATSATILGTSIIMSGYATRMIDVGGGTMVPVKGAFVSEYTFAGNSPWTKNFDPVNANETVGFLRSAADASHVYLTGTFLGTFKVGATTLTAGDYNIFAMSLDANGDVAWVRYWGGTGLQSPTSLIASGNDLYLAGMTAATMALEQDSNTGPLCNKGLGTCMFLLNLSNNGKTIWGQEFGNGGTESDEARLLRMDGGDLWLTGSWEGATLDFGTGNLMKFGNRDVIVARFPSTTFPN